MNDEKVFPACAGMNHEAFRFAEQDKRFPRMRGDEPPAAIPAKSPWRFSPHARG